MNSKESTYRSLVMRKVQQLAKEHGGLAKIPRELQKKLGFDVIAKRKTHTISVRIPSGDLTSRIAELKNELPSISFDSAKPDAETIFGKYAPSPFSANSTMEDFWIKQGWFRRDRIGIELTNAKWNGDRTVRIEAVRFLLEHVLKKDPKEVIQEIFTQKFLASLPANYREDSSYAAIFESVGFLIKQAPKKDPRDVTKRDFVSNGLKGLLGYYSNSPYNALLDAGYACSHQESLQHAKTGNFQTAKLYPWEMSITRRGFYDSKENRVAATKWLAWKLKKDPRDIIYEDFLSNRLTGLIGVTGGAYEALFEADLVAQADEQYMRSNRL